MPWVTITTSPSLSPASRDAIAADVIHAIGDITGKPAASIMISFFSDIPPSNWGWNHKTFA